MAFQLAPPPSTLVEREQQTNRVTDQITTVFRQWLLSLTGRIGTASHFASPATVSGSGASIGVTALGAAVAPGIYRVSFYARITRPGTVSSSLTVTLSWTDGGVACTKSFTAITGNTTGTTGSETYLVRSDSGTNVSYSTTYASVGATTMTYDLVVELESIG